MGSSASIAQVSAKDVGAFIGGLEGGVHVYKDKFLQYAIDGHMLASMDDEALMETLEELGITSKLHRKKLTSELNKIKTLTTSKSAPELSNTAFAATEAVITASASASAAAAAAATAAAAAEAAAAAAEAATATAKAAVQQAEKFLDKLILPPSVLMSRLFMIQGVHCDPSDVDSCVLKLLAAIKAVLAKSIEKGIQSKEFSCFINYRVSADREVAEKIYLNLKIHGLNPFLDSKSLISGEKWKDGFLRGLISSDCFLAIISPDALAPARDLYRDHSMDNVLLEYQMALNINDARKAAKKPEFIVPLHVAKNEGGEMLRKFGGTDFDAKLYSDSVEAKVKTAEVERKRLLAVKEDAERKKLEEEQEKAKKAKALQSQTPAALESLISKNGIASVVIVLRSGTAQAKTNAASALARHALKNDANRVRIAAEGATGPLIALVRDGTADGKINAVVALTWLSNNNADNKVRIAAEGGIGPLIALVRDGTAEGKTNAAIALQSLAINADNRVRIAAEGGIGPLIALVRDGSAEGKTNAATALCNVSCSNADNQVCIAAEGGIGPLIALVRDGAADGKSNAATALGNLSSNAGNQVRIAEEGGIGPLIALVRNGTTEGKKNAATALGNLAANNDNKVRIATEGGIGPLIALVRDGTVKGKTNAAGALCWLVVNDADNAKRIAREGGIRPLIALLQDGTAEGKTDAARALDWLINNADNKKTIRDSGLQIIEAATIKETDAAAKKQLQNLLGKIKS